MPHRFIARQIKRFVIYRVLSINDTPHRIALGVAIAIFITWTPTIGLQMVLTLALATLLRANKIVGLPLVWISNPVTIPVIYGPNYWVGCKILSLEFSLDRVTSIATSAFSANGSWFSKVQTWWEATWGIFAPLWLGSVIVGLVLALVLYCLTYYGVSKFRGIYHHFHPLDANPPNGNSKNKSNGH